jgi:N-acetylneuraminate synthase
MFRERYGCFVGLSDHSGTIYPALANATLGGDVIEVHVTMSRGMFGPDVPASVTMEEMRQLVTGVRFIETMGAHPVEKDAVARDMAPLRAIFTKSVVARVPLAKGTVLDAGHLSAKKPGTGLPADRQLELVGRRLRRAIAADEQVRLEDLEDFEETV